MTVVTINPWRALAALLVIVAPVGATAAETSFASGGYSFSLSLDPILQAAGAMALSAPSVPFTSGTGQQAVVRTEFGGAHQEWRVPYSSPGTFGGIVSGTNSVSTAPVGFTGNYMAITSSGGAATATTWFWEQNWQNQQMKAATVLWGSVSAGETLAFYGSNSWAPLTGDAILAAASAQGLSGGSYYVTVNALGGNNFSGIMATRETAGTLEYAILQTSKSNYVPVAVTPVVVEPIMVAPASPVQFAPAPAAPADPITAPSGVPAPVLGATPMGGLASFALLMGLAMRRSRRARLANAGEQAARA